MRKEFQAKQESFCHTLGHTHWFVALNTCEIFQVKVVLGCRNLQETRINIFSLVFYNLKLRHKYFTQVPI
jgi:hypothetical protein